MSTLTWKLCVGPDGHEVRLLEAVASCDAALSPHQVVKDQPASPALAGRELLQVDADFQLNVVADALDALWRVVLADEVLFATLEEPEVSLVHLLYRQVVHNFM